MNFKRLVPTLLGIFLFYGGILISLSVSSVMLWGELEARVYISQTGDKSLKIECPLVIAPWETAEIKTVVTNSLLDDSTKPQVNAFISQAQGKEARLISETLQLAPLESRAMQWTVSNVDIIFERLILVNILQRPYRDLPSHQGACSILVYSLFGLNGASTLYTLVAVSVFASLIGMLLLVWLQHPLKDARKSFAQVSGIFFLLSVLGLFTALTRLWGLTLIFDAAALLAFIAGSIEILMPKST